MKIFKDAKIIDKNNNAMFARARLLNLKNVTVNADYKSLLYKLCGADNYDGAKDAIT